MARLEICKECDRVMNSSSCSSCPEQISESTVDERRTDKAYNFNHEIYKELYVSQKEENILVFGRLSAFDDISPIYLFITDRCDDIVFVNRKRGMLESMKRAFYSIFMSADFSGDDDVSGLKTDFNISQKVRNLDGWPDGKGIRYSNGRFTCDIKRKTLVVTVL